MNKLKKSIFYISPIIIILIAISCGSQNITLTSIIDVISYKISGYTIFNTTLTTNMINIVWNIRLPRIILTLLVGSSLSVSGATLQAILKNPLVDPYTLGLSSGAIFGVALSIIIPVLPRQITAFIFGLLGVMVCYTLSNNNDEISTLALILSGVMVSSVFTALYSLIQLMIDPLKLQGLVYWMMGSFHTASWNKVYSVIIVLIISLLVIYKYRWRLNILSLEDKEARYLGVDLKKNKMILIFFASILATSSVSVSGVISLVGLMIPHIVRLLFGADNRNIIPVSMCLGGAYLTFVDIFSRSLMSFEIPIGIFTTLIGAPFFIYLLRKSVMGRN
ncbi:putative ABC transporter permease protein [Terrisporobacter petrolearius]|uniref:FecCD family ABC transporter permease n=1 Tax=Terrisporobacter petrolearius TaxID=1460447 RepID=UPI003367E656